MCAPLLRPVVTHQSAGRARGKYEVTVRLSGRAAAAGISLSLSLSHTDCSFHARDWVACSYSAPLSKRISRRVWQMQISCGRVRGWQWVLNMMDGYYGGSWLLFNTPWEEFGDTNQSVWLDKHVSVGISKAKTETRCPWCGAICAKILIFHNFFNMLERLWHNVFFRPHWKSSIFPHNGSFRLFLM